MAFLQPIWETDLSHYTLSLFISSLNVGLSSFSFYHTTGHPSIDATSVFHCRRSNDKHTLTADPKPTSHGWRWVLDILLLKHLWIYFFRPCFPREAGPRLALGLREDFQGCLVLRNQMKCAGLQRLGKWNFTRSVRSHIGLNCIGWTEESSLPSWLVRNK